MVFFLIFYPLAFKKDDQLLLNPSQRKMMRPTDLFKVLKSFKIRIVNVVTFEINIVQIFQSCT